ncbi:hypothetical protein BH759_20110 [Ralstonia solanacearum]|nr:hypothetical protein BH759_20110 [Ralstonia solanacearum]
MRNRCAIIVIACLCCLITSSPVFAWGSAGHMAIGHIADQLLEGSSAQQHVQTILGKEGTLRDAAIWPDCAKYIQPTQDFQYSPDPRYYDKQCAIYESDAGKQEMSDYVRRNNDNCEYAGHKQNCHKAFHFADIPIQEDHYDRSFVGATDTDVVHAINAAIAVLRGVDAPPPFQFASGEQGQREALRLLAHFVGDLHQPLHVGAIYLSNDGSPVNPDVSGYDPATNNEGGNLLQVGAKAELHGEWDKISRSLAGEDLSTDASAITTTTGEMDTWATQWASETVLQARNAYSGLSFGAEQQDNRGKVSWPLTFGDRRAYLDAEHTLQRQQVIKAGARLAQVLRVIWPD